MIQECQGFQNRYAGRIEEHERRVAQVIGSAARDALRGRASHILHEQQVLHQAGQRQEEFEKSQMHSEPRSHIVSYRRSLRDREVKQERITQNLEYQDAQLNVQFHTEELIMT